MNYNTRTVEQWKATKTREKCLCTKDQFSALRIREFMHAHIITYFHLCHNYLLNCHVQYLLQQ
jgi:hypothetical protein